MDKAKELSKNPFKIKNKYNKELEVINKIIDKNSKLPESELAEKLINDIEKLVVKTKDAIQSHVRGNVLSDLGYSELAQLFFNNAKKLGYEVEDMTNENYEESIDNVNPDDLKLRYFVFSGAYDPNEDPDFEENIEDFLNTYPEQLRDEARSILMDLHNNGETIETTESVENNEWESIVKEAVMTSLEEDIAEDLYPKIIKLKHEKGSFTVKDLENIILNGGGDLKMVDLVMLNLVEMGFNFDNETEEYSDEDLNFTLKENLRNVTVEYENGDFVNTDMAAHLTDEEIYDYFKIGKVFNIGSGENDNLQAVKNVTINENNIIGKYEVHYSDGIRASKKFNNLRSALDFSSQLITLPKMQNVSVYKDSNNFHSTASADHLIAWWGEGSYWDNVSKKHPELEEKKLENLLNLSTVESHQQTLPLVADVNPNYNIYGDDMPVNEKPKFNIDAVKRLIEDDAFLKFSYNNLLTGDFEKDMEFIYNTYIKNDDVYSNKLKAYESYVYMLKENIVMSSIYTEDIQNILNAFSVDLADEKVELLYDIAAYISDNATKFKSYLNLLTPDLKQEYRTSIASLNPVDIAMKIYNSKINLSNDIADNNEKISDVLGISSQLSMVLLNIFKSVGSDLKYKHFSDNTVINSVIFIIVVTLIIKYNA